MMQRTEWAEQFAEMLAAKPLVHECVFRNLRYLDGTEKEVCDLLLTLRNQAILVQMKCQEDPTQRLGDKLERWVLKQAERASDQLRGALHTVSERDFWCCHPRRGRVDFLGGKLEVLHGVVLVEHFDDRITLPGTFPMTFGGIPVSYFTTNDFLKVVDQLRAFPEIVSYLQQRYRLPEESLRAVGGERVLYEYYILNEGTFDRWKTYQEASLALDIQQRVSQSLNDRKVNADRDAFLIEYVADSLSSRSEDFAADLPANLVQGFDPEAHRENYLRMQEELCDLNLSTRRALGAKFREVIDKVQASGKPSDMVYAGAHTDSKPSFLYVFVSSRAVPRPELLNRLDVLLRAGLTHFGKQDGMVIADRDGLSFDVILRKAFVPSEVDRRLAQQYFESLKMFDIPTSMVPGSVNR